jgi:membrane fusion protein (multidrug efflux system)
MIAMQGRRRSVALGAVLLGLAGCSTAQGDSEDQTAADSVVAVRVINVEVTTAAPTTFTDFISVTGEVEAYHDVTISAEETGVITEFLVAKGRPVRRGEVIARIDAEVLTALVNEARASAELAQEQFERQRRLWEDEGIGSEIAYLQARSQAAVQQARRETLEARLARTAIRSPVSGVFDDRYLEAGEMAVVGAPVARVVSIDRLKVVGGVPERFAQWVHQNDEAIISFEILPDRSVAGTIDYVGSTVDDRSRTFRVEIVIDNPDGIVKPQMVANVQLERTRLADVIVVPQEVVSRTEFGYQVYVVVERDGVRYASARQVVLGPGYADRVVIEEGLEFGDQVVTAGAQLVDDGNRVRIVESGEE